MNTDPLSLLAKMPPGSALIAREQIDGGNWEIAWLIREKSRRLAKLGQAPEVEFRAALFWEERVGLIPVLVRVGPASKVSVYETWINEHAEGSHGTLATLSDQERLVVHLYGDGCRLVRTMAVSNHLEDFARCASAEIAKQPAWPMQAYDQARERIYQRHATVWDLWEALGRKGTTHDGA
jgi:hypothetical protein